MPAHKRKPDRKRFLAVTRSGGTGRRRTAGDLFFAAGAGPVGSGRRDAETTRQVSTTGRAPARLPPPPSGASPSPPSPPLPPRRLGARRVVDWRKRMWSTCGRRPSCFAPRGARGRCSATCSAPGTRAPTFAGGPPLSPAAAVGPAAVGIRGPRGRRPGPASDGAGDVG